VKNTQSTADPYSNIKRFCWIPDADLPKK